jgi:hypothetical protein
MKSYLVKEYGDGMMGAGPEYYILKKKELEHVNYFGDFLDVYELVTPKPISKKKMKDLGIPFMEDKNR